MSFIKKLGNGLKKIMPAAGAIMSFIPAIGPLIGGAVSAAGRAWASSDNKQPDTGALDIDMGTTPQTQPPVVINGQGSGTNWGQLISSAMPLATGALNYYGQRQANAANAQQAQQQMDFQASQTGTAYQRGTADMKAAGLNPMLAYSQGGAQSGGGAQAQIGNELAPGANSALSAMHTLQEISNMEASNAQTYANTDLIESQAEKTRAEKLNVIASNPLIRGQTVESERRGANLLPEGELKYLQARLLRDSMDDQLKEISSSAALRTAQAKHQNYGLSKDSAEAGFWGSKIGKAYPYVTAAGDTLNSAASAASKFIPKFGGR